MKNGARYVVTTRWGTFSLDEGSYQDYLAGRLWICWTPGQPEPKETHSNYIPPTASNRALALRDQAEKIGILAALRQAGIDEAFVPYSDRLAGLDIDEMNLTVRSRNGLKRANLHTFGLLKKCLETETGLTNIRNIGQKSIKEIKQMFFNECYSRLLPYEKAYYWQEVLDSTTVL